MKTNASGAAVDSLSVRFIQRISNVGCIFFITKLWNINYEIYRIKFSICLRAYLLSRLSCLESQNDQMPGLCLNFIYICSNISAFISKMSQNIHFKVTIEYIFVRNKKTESVPGITVIGRLTQRHNNVLLTETPYVSVRQNECQACIRQENKR
jgi:hypothetical protein